MNKKQDLFPSCPLDIEDQSKTAVENQQHASATGTVVASNVKQPYIKPAFRFERVFVTTALSCGKVDSTEGQCAHNTKVS